MSFLCSIHFNYMIYKSELTRMFSIRGVFNFLAPVHPKIFVFLVRCFDFSFAEILVRFLHIWHKFLLAVNPSSIKRIYCVFRYCHFSKRSLPSFRRCFGNLKINVPVVQRVTCSRVKKFCRQNLIF